MEIKKYFKIEELVDKTVFEKYGESAWKFIDKDLLACLLVVREGIGFPMTINNWKWGGNFSQRGLRHNMSSLVKNKTKLYLSAHIFGKAVDFDVQGMSAVFEKYGESAWKFIDKDLLACLLVVREGIGFPMTINNWKWGGNFSQRGLRHNMSSLVKNKTKLYLSAHIFGKAVRDRDWETYTLPYHK